MKKQFFRVKQLADQTFSRAGKTEVLSDDLQAADKRVDFIRVACQSTGKKLAGSLLGQGQDASAREKRLKKNPEYLLGVCMLESGSCDEDYLLRHVVSECGKLEMCLANACVDHESKVEANVLTPLHQVCETDVPNIMKHKRNLAKLILDMDSARTRYQAALKHSNSSTQGNKVESIRDELEEAETKVEQCRDLLACEMFQLISKEADIAATVLEYAKLQRAYHQTALATLDEMIPELESSIADSSMKPVFGVPLEEHLRVTERKIAYPIELCVCALNELGMDEEGLFRVAGGASKVRRMKLSLDANCMSLETALEYRDPHVIASVLKSYLRQLPEPLMTHRLHDEWMAAARVATSNDARLQALWSVVQKLPQANLDNLRYLIKFLALLSKNQETNKMTPQNIAIVIAPNLLWSPADDGNSIGMNMNTANLHSIIVDSLVSYADWFFPGELELYVTFSKEGLLNGHTRSSSGDTQLITVNDSGMKRTQSNSSLSEDHSPPHGSPKPIARNRKSKPAPVPPSNPPSSNSSNNKENIDKQNSNNNNSTSINSNNSIHGSKDNLSDIKPVVSSNQSSQVTTATPTSTTIAAAKSDNETENKPSLTVAEATQTLIGFEKLVATAESNQTIKEGSAGKEEIKQKDDATAVTTQESETPVTRVQCENMYPRCPQTDSTPPPPVPLLPATVATTKPEPVCNKPNVANKPDPNFRGSVELIYGTLERKRPPRPTPAPRTSLESSSSGGEEGSARKPVVPERPATLQRPLSSSFRMSRNMDTTPVDNAEKNIVDNQNNDRGPISLERAHVYSVDKQQVSIIQVSNDKVAESKTGAEKKEADKPERPPKPEILLTHGSGHHRAASEGNIIDYGAVPGSPRNPTRPPRPTPPPPPPAKVRESTDL